MRGKSNSKSFLTYLRQVSDDGQIHPVAYASCSLLKHERNYAITELEMLALVWSVKHFRASLLGHKYVVYTDHAACTSLLNTPHISSLGNDSIRNGSGNQTLGWQGKHQC